MTKSLSTKSFLERSATVLEPAFHAVAERLLANLGDDVTRLAYFHNPHVVFTLRLSSVTDDVRKCLTSLWSQERRTFLSGLHLRENAHRQRCAEVEGGIHDARSAHVESYIDSVGKGREYALHRSGRSFRIRVSQSRESHRRTDVRILLVLTHCPVTDGAFLPLDPVRHWKQLDLKRFPEFGPIVSEKTWLEGARATSSVAECFVLFTKDWETGVKALEAAVVDGIDSTLEVVTRNRKLSTRVTLRPWDQEPRSGVMQPDWAYVVLDEVQLFPTTKIADRLGEHHEKWSHIFQVEIEVGPTPALLRPAAALMTASRRLLEELHVEAVPASGRKFHRLLVDAGINEG